MFGGCKLGTQLPEPVVWPAWPRLPAPPAWALQWLKPGLMANVGLEVLDFTACNLTDHVARSIGGVIKVSLAGQ